MKKRYLREIKKKFPLESIAVFVEPFEKKYAYLCTITKYDGVDGDTFGIYGWPLDENVRFRQFGCFNICDMSDTNVFTPEEFVLPQGCKFIGARKMTVATANQLAKDFKELFGKKII